MGRNGQVLGEKPSAPKFLLYVCRIGDAAAIYARFIGEPVYFIKGIAATEDEIEM